MGATNKTNEIWTIEYPKEPYEVNLDEINLEVVYKSRCKYDLRAAARRHRHFFYHVSLPHYRSGPFLHESIERFFSFIHHLLPKFTLAGLGRAGDKRYLLRPEYFSISCCFREKLINSRSMDVPLPTHTHHPLGRCPIWKILYLPLLYLFLLATI